PTARPWVSRWIRTNPPCLRFTVCSRPTRKKRRWRRIFGAARSATATPRSCSKRRSTPISRRSATSARSWRHGRITSRTCSAKAVKRHAWKRRRRWSWCGRRWGFDCEAPRESDMRKSATNTVKPLKRKPAAPQKRGKPSNGALPDWTAKYAADPDEVAIFCRRHRLFDAATTTLTLAQEVYQPLAVRAYVMHDPEGSHEWLIFEVDLPGNVEAALDKEKRFVERWLALLPASKLLLIRVLDNFI